MDHGFDPLQSELKRVKKSQDVENKLIGVRYSCPNCEYAAITASTLKIHVESKHKVEISMFSM